MTKRPKAPGSSALLAIEVEYLLGRVHAAEFRDVETPEWPPQPARLFSALVAAHHDGDGTGPERELLAWLERQAPPLISAKAAGKPNQVVTFVPTNYAGKSGSTHPEQRSKQARSFAVQGPASPIVQFVWPKAEPSSEQRDALTGLVSRVAALGRASSMVRVRVVDDANGVSPNFIPDDEGKIVLAVTARGRLEELERSYRAGRRPQQGIPARYVNRDDLRASKVPDQGHFGEMVVLRRSEGLGLPIESTSLLTKQLRKAFLSQAGGGELLDPVLSGHDEDKPAKEPHVAFAALPNVGGGFGDGRLMGIAIILPKSISKANRRIAIRACASIDEINLSEEIGKWKVEIANFDVPQQTLRAETWMKASMRWGTVTPILLDRYPKKDFTTEELLIAACVRAGFPVPVRCTYGPYAQNEYELKGVPPVSTFPAERWAVHACLEFDGPVKGPVLLGAGRFFGMGLMKPLSGRRRPESE